MRPPVYEVITRWPLADGRTLRIWSTVRPTTPADRQPSLKLSEATLAVWSGFTTVQLIRHLSTLDWVSAAEIVDSEGAGLCVYYNWP